jgi:hypothetical protein
MSDLGIKQTAKIVEPINNRVNLSDVEKVKALIAKQAAKDEELAAKLKIERLRIRLDQKRDKAFNNRHKQQQRRKKR